MSLTSNMAGVVRNGRLTLVDGSTGLRRCFGWYSHSSPRRRQGPHSGETSSHLTFLLLQLEHPPRDLVWPFLGMGRRFVVPGAGGPGVADDSEAE